MEWPERVSPAQDAIVHAGDTLPVAVSGKIDINQDTRHESHCDLGLFCHPEDIPVHNFMTPAQAPVRFEVRPVGGGPAVENTIVGTAPAVLELPTSDTAFETS